MAKRPDYHCNHCHHTWLPQRRYPPRCPKCSSNDIKENRTSWLGLLWVACLAVGAFYYLSIQEQDKVTSPKKDPQKIAFSELTPPKPPGPEIDPNIDLTLKKLPQDQKKAQPQLIKISASIENAPGLAQKRYQEAGALYKEYRFEESPLALIKIQDALINIAEAKQLIAELGALDKFGDTTLTRLLKELAISCHRRIYELEQLGIKWPKGRKKNIEVEIVEEDVPVVLKPVVINKSGYGGKDAFYAKFKIENNGPKTTMRNIVVIFVDSIGLEIGKQAIATNMDIENTETKKFSAKYLGKNADQIKTFKVQFQ
ncbi:MAG: hypothetical protein P1V97_34215 [Planctomycetota bacterium]|nr:hypothetical protein [Planctomycetota bacterium]